MYKHHMYNHHCLSARREFVCSKDLWCVVGKNKQLIADLQLSNLTWLCYLISYFVKSCLVRSACRAQLKLKNETVKRFHFAYRYIYWIFAQLLIYFAFWYELSCAGKTRHSALLIFNLLFAKGLVKSCIAFRAGQ